MKLTHVEKNCRMSVFILYRRYQLQEFVMRLSFPESLKGVNFAKLFCCCLQVKYIKT